MLQFYHNLPLLIRAHNTLLASMCHVMPFWTRTLKKKNIFFDFDTGKKQIKMWFRGLYSFRQWVRFITFFSQTMFSYCFCMLASLQKFLKESWRVQVAHLHNVARVLSSRSWCFQLSTNLNFGIKHIECG